MKNSENCKYYPNVTQRHEVIKCCWKKWHQQICLTQCCHKVSICQKCNICECNKAKHNKMRYAYKYGTQAVLYLFIHLLTYPNYMKIKKVLQVKATFTSMRFFGGEEHFRHRKFNSLKYSHITNILHKYLNIYLYFFFVFL